ncbi:MAG: TIGR01777 family oxidoreductase [Planctomycetota bacterium]
MTEINDKKVVITGGTGFLGQAVAQRLESLGCRVTIVSRNPPKGSHSGRWVGWDGRSLGEWAEALNGATAVVNLAGRTVDCKKTPDHCDEILRSRVDSVHAVGEALRRCDNPPAVWVQMATAHIYGDPPDSICDESAAIGYGLAPLVGGRWESAHEQACPPSVRSVVLRTSFVLGNTGGAFPVLKRLARFGLGGKIASGKQWVSWLHVDDMVAILLRAIRDETMRGVYNATAPQAATNRQFMRALRKAMRMPIGLPAAGWMVRLGAATVMNTDPDLVLYGRSVVPKRLLEEGYQFKHGELDRALSDLVAA